MGVDTMTPEEIEQRIKRLEYAMLGIAQWGFQQGLYLGICMNASLHPNVGVPHWMPAPYINWEIPIINMPGDYTKENYPEDFQDD